MDSDGYKIKNLNLASFLSACGLRLVKTAKVGSEIFFIFRPRDQAEKLINSYFQGTAKVDPKRLFESLNSLRDLVFSTGGQAHG